jgi:multidrug efflux system membrane fusion protein
MRFARAVGTTVVGVLIIGAASVWHFGLPAAGRRPTQTATPNAIPVTVATAQAKDVPVYVEGLGTVQAYNQVNIVSRVSGQITQVFFREGQEVNKGDELFKIDPRPYQAALEQAQAAKQKDEAQLKSAELDLERDAQLLPQGFQTRQSYDQQHATVQQLRASIQADQAQIDSAQLNVSFTVIRSPIAGRSGQRMVDVGNVVQAGQNAVLATITQVKPIFVSFNVPADRLDEIRKNQAQGALKIIAYGMDDKTKLQEGKLTLIDNRVDTTTGTIHLKAEFANDNERLWPGESVNARLVLTTRQNAVTVPAQTVMQGPKGAYVYILDNNDVAKRHNVEVSATQHGMAVIGAGLTAGERVVVDGQYRLIDGSKVKTASSEQPVPEQHAEQ